MFIRRIKRLYIALSSFFWLCLSILNTFVFFSEKVYIPTEYSDFLSNYLLASFFIFTLLFFKVEIGRHKHTNYNELLTYVLFTGIISILISLFIRYFLSLEKQEHLLLNTIFYHINLGLITIFISSTFYVWKKLILHQKNQLTTICWNIFEVLAYISVSSSFFIFDLTDPVFYLYASPIIILAIILSLNLKWIAYLNYKQKLLAVLQMGATLLISVTYTLQIYDHQISKISIALWDNVFILGMFAFISLYALSSLLILIFHLPTSSIYDKKIEEVKIYQRLNQALREGSKVNEFYNLLLKETLELFSTQAGWIEITDEKGNYKAFVNLNISEIDVFEIKKILRKNHIQTDKDPFIIKSISKLNHTQRISGTPYKSLTILPLHFNEEHLGVIYMVSNAGASNSRSKADLLQSYCNQASLSVKNFSLLADALENQRYKEEVKIAKEVQNSLLPKSFEKNDIFQIDVFTMGSDIVGGDYYDIYYYPDKEKVAIVIGDVSGKGTSAAFNMAQMKGVFQSLIPIETDTIRFMNDANKALIACLEKRVFISLSLFIIDKKNSTIQYSRAGHCPAIYYSAHNNSVRLLDAKGLGLGIIRNHTYIHHITQETISYLPNDIMVLYTDGVIEAINSENQQYGHQHMFDIIEKYKNDSASIINGKIIENLYAFTGSRKINDDYTVLVIKFT